MKTQYLEIHQINNNVSFDLTDKKINYHNLQVANVWNLWNNRMQRYGRYQENERHPHSPGSG